MNGSTYNNSSTRPVINLPRTYWDWFFDGASLLALIMTAGILIHFWPALPETVPTHFGFSGEVDAWGSRNSLFILPATGLVFFVILTALGFFPHSYNYLFKITEENAQAQYRLARTLMGCLKMQTIFLFSYMEWQTIMTSLGKSDGMGQNLIFVIVGIMFGTIGIYFYRSARAR